MKILKGYVEILGRGDREGRDDKLKTKQKRVI